MNRAATKAAAPFLTDRGNHLPYNAIAAAFFHSTTVLERRRNSQFRFNSYAMRFRRKEAKRTLLRDANMYLEHLMEGFRNSQEDYPVCASSNYTSWFENQYFVNGRRKKNLHNQRFQSDNYPRKRKGSQNIFWNGTDDEECGTIFGSAFGERQDFYWSSFNGKFERGLPRYRNERVYWDRNDNANSEYFWRGSFRQRNKTASSGWKDGSDNESDASTMSNVATERLTLGLTASGPLNLEEVKSAYRACALKWHPDRHQGSSKVAAEEKFKYCTAAYKSICDKLVKT